MLLREIQELAREVETVAGERDHYKQLAEVFKRELDRLNDLQKTRVNTSTSTRFGSRSSNSRRKSSRRPAERRPARPIRTREKAHRGGSGNSNGKTPIKRDAHGRSPLPEHLPVRTLVLTPDGIAANAR